MVLLAVFVIGVGVEAGVLGLVAGIVELSDCWLK